MFPSHLVSAIREGPALTALFLSGVGAFVALRLFIVFQPRLVRRFFLLPFANPPLILDQVLILLAGAHFLT